MGAQRSDDPQQFARASRFQSRDVGEDDAPQPWIPDTPQPNLMAGDVLFNLLDEGQMVGQLHQALVRLDALVAFIVAAQAAMRTASSLSFLARRRCWGTGGFEVDRLQNQKR